WYARRSVYWNCLAWQRHSEDGHVDANRRRRERTRGTDASRKRPGTALRDYESARQRLALSREPGLPRDAGAEHTRRTKAVRLQAADADDATVKHRKHGRRRGIRTTFAVQRPQIKAPRHPKMIGALYRPTAVACGTTAADDFLLPPILKSESSRDSKRNK